MEDLGKTKAKVDEEIKAAYDEEDKKIDEIDDALDNDDWQ